MSLFKKKVAKIKAQLDTFKSEDRYATLQKAFISQPPPPQQAGSGNSPMNNNSSANIQNPVKTPTIPHVGENTLHPNTPNYGFEFSTPPNLKTSASANYFPILTSVTSSSISDPRSSTSSHGASDTADSASPLSSSPNRHSALKLEKKVQFQEYTKTRFLHISKMAKKKINFCTRKKFKNYQK